jgi:hypothetical protein
MNQSAELQLGAMRKRAELELRAPMPLRFTVPKPAWSERGLSMNRECSELRRLPRTSWPVAKLICGL